MHKTSRNYLCYIIVDLVITYALCIGEVRNAHRMNQNQRYEVLMHFNQRYSCRVAFNQRYSCLMA